MQIADLTEKKWNIINKIENYKLKKYIKIFESIYKNAKNNYKKFGDIEIQKQKFHQHEGPISIKNINVNKVVVSNKVCFGKKKRI